MKPPDVTFSEVHDAARSQPEADDPWPVPMFHVMRVRRNADRVDERIGMLADGRRIRATVSAGVLEIEVANPVVGPQKGRRYYHLHRGKMRLIMLKVIGGYSKHTLTYAALKEHTRGFIAWPEKECRDL